MSRYVHIADTFDIQDLQRHQGRDEDCLRWQDKISLFTKENGILWRKTPAGLRAAVPKSLRVVIMKQQHDSLLSGHCGKSTTNRKIAMQYWWPRRRIEVDQYVASCLECQKRTLHGSIEMPMQSLPQCKKRFELVGMDIMYLPTSAEGYRYVLTLIDHFSRYLIMVPLKDQTAETIAEAIVLNFILTFGVPQSVLSDQGQNFLSLVWQNICKLLGVKKLRTSPYRPQCNGKTESVQGKIKKILSHYLNARQDNWPKILPYAVSCHNAKPHSSTGRSPNEIVFIQKITSAFDVVRDHIDEVEEQGAQSLADRLQSVWEEVEKQDEISFNARKARHDKKIKVGEFTVGQEVLLRDTVVKQGLSGKLGVKYSGPFIITKIVSPVLVQLQLKKRLVIVHMNRIKACKQRQKYPLQISCPQELDTAAEPALHSRAESPVGQQSGEEQPEEPPATAPLHPPQPTPAAAVPVDVPIESAADPAETASTRRPPPRRSNLRSTSGRKRAGFYREQ